MSRAAELQLPLNDIDKVYPALVRALAEAGEAPARIEELANQHLRIRCVGCAQRITGDDLAHLALGGPDATAPNSRIERLRLGYCAKPECNSRFYVASADTGMVAWPAILSRTRHFIDNPPTPVAAAPAPSPAESAAKDGKPGTPASREAEEDAPARRQLTFQEQWRRIQFGALAGVVGVGLLFWWWHSGVRIPGFGPAPRQFEVHSAPPNPSMPQMQPQPSGSNGVAPRSFRAQ